MPDIAPTHARQTKRFGDVGHAVAHAFGGRAGERLSRRLGIPVGRNALLRGVKRWARSRLPAGPIPVIGVDEWAWRKGQNYGTILVDLERGVVADLLANRSAASFETWLREHPGVTVVSRDRDGVYAEGGYSGAPRAQQVADRFNVVQSLIRAVQDELAHRRGALRMPTQEIVGRNSQEGATIAVPEPEAATVHANDAISGLIRLESLIAEATSAPQQTLIAEAVDLVVFVDAEPDLRAGRKVREVLLVTGYRDGQYQVEHV